MKYKPSAFYANFSLSDLVKKSPLWKAENMGTGGGGGGGGSTRNDLGKGDSNQARYHKTESFSGQIKSTTDERLDMAELLPLLKEEIAKEISGRGANVTSRDGRDQAGFFLEYGEEGIQGRIEISGSIARNSYHLRADLTETSTSTRKPVVEKSLKRGQPAGNYYVVAFMPEDVRASTKIFYDTGRAAIQDSFLRVRQKYIADPSKRPFSTENLLSTEVYVWQPMPAELKRQWKEEVWDEEIDVPAEYDQYGIVYFLNEGALRMYKEAGEEFEILKIISAEEVSKIPGPSLRGPYLPKDE